LFDLRVLPGASAAHIGYAPRTGRRGESRRRGQAQHCAGTGQERDEEQPYLSTAVVYPASSPSQVGNREPRGR
jgi:hypothetical protein